METTDTPDDAVRIVLALNFFLLSILAFAVGS